MIKFLKPFLKKTFQWPRNKWFYLCASVFDYLDQGFTSYDKTFILHDININRMINIKYYWNMIIRIESYSAVLDVDCSGDLFRSSPLDQSAV